MEPGHEDREYPDQWPNPYGDDLASMEPGHEDREYGTGPVLTGKESPCLNGARS